ncbi:MAG: 8-amino-7-oxononanoate synthase [Blastopirellula sp.]|nr:MAG: 8-amino-7-oxononanoate synthase [Blastopirellula sp.]
MTYLKRYLDALDSLKSRGRHRILAPRAGHDFVSNDYLGLAGSEILNSAAKAALDRGVSLGSGGSRLLRGNTSEHELLETEAATFFNTERALFFGAGFTANSAIFSSLPDRDDLVVHDALIHASAHDGMRLGRADTVAFAHNNVTHAENLIKDWRAKGGAGRIWLAFESVYSMDGDLAPVEDLVALANQHDAFILADEAHATGVFGDHGRGLMHNYARAENVLTLHTCGKGLGVSGALVCGASPLIDTLINRARGFVFATAPSPLTATLVRAALAEIRMSEQRQTELKSLVAHAHALAEKHCGLSNLSSQIIPVIIGADKTTMGCAAELQANGFDIRGIRPPTVPQDTSRLRISITLNTSAEIISEMFAILGKELETLR